MAQSADPGNFFQTSSSIEEIDRKARKAKNNTAGNPIKLSSKLLSIEPDPFDEGRVFVAEAAGCLRRVSLDSEDTSHVYSGPTAPLTSIAIGRSHVFAGCWDKSIWSWEIETRKPGRRFISHSDFVKDVICVRVKGREILISGAADAVILAWDVETGRKLWTLKGHIRGVQCLAIDPFANDMPEKAQDGSLVLFSGGSVGELRRWAFDGVQQAKETTEEKDGGKNFPITAHETSIYQLRFDADGDLWTASADKTVKCLSREKGWKVEMTLAHPDFVRDVVIDEMGGKVATACRDEEIRIWDRGTGQLYHIFTGHFEEVTGLVLLLSRQRLVSASIDGTIRQWSIRPKDLLAAREESLKTVEDESDKKVEKPSMLTADEEQELADLMGDDSN